MEPTRAFKKVTIVLPDEQADEDVGGADGTVMHDSTSSRVYDSVCVSESLSVPGQDGSSVSLHGQANSYIAIGTGGSVIPDYGSCLAGGKPFKYHSSPTQLAVARGPPPLLPIPGPSLTHSIMQSHP